MGRTVRVGVSVVLSIGALAAVGYSLSEQRRAVEHARSLEVRLTELRDEMVGVRDRLAVRDERVEFLEVELRARVEQMDVLTREVERQRGELEAERQATNEVRGRAFRPMPEGVRLAVRTLEELLRADGYDGIRVLRAERLDGLKLHEIELLENDFVERRTTYYRARTLAVELDREAGAAVLRFSDGHALVAGELAEYPEGGLTLALPRVDGPVWEARMPYLVEAHGRYPESEGAIADASRVDPITRSEWEGRLDSLLAVAATEVRWRLARFRGLEDGALLDVLVLGHGSGGLLERSAEADRAAIEVDRTDGTVALLLSGGILHRRAGSTTIPESGYRIALPGVTAELAIETMLGMVVDRSR